MTDPIPFADLSLADQAFILIHHRPEIRWYYEPDDGTALAFTVWAVNDPEQFARYCTHIGTAADGIRLVVLPPELEVQS